MARAWAGGVATGGGHRRVPGDRPSGPWRSPPGSRGSRPRRASIRTTRPGGRRRRATGSAACSAVREVVAAGEMGLDYHYDHSPRDAQRAAFEAQLALARRGGEAGRDPRARGRRRRRGGAPRARRTSRRSCTRSAAAPASCGRGWTSATMCRSAGWSPSRTGAWTEAILETPLDRLLVETDGPYLAPVPHRGKRNEPAFVRQVAERIAAVRGMAVEELVAATAANAARVFRFPLP